MADESNYADGEILWVTSQDVKVDYLSDTTTKLSEKGASELKLYPAGTLLMVTRSGILRHTLPVYHGRMERILLNVPAILVVAKPIIHRIPAAHPAIIPNLNAA